MPFQRNIPCEESKLLGTIGSSLISKKTTGWAVDCRDLEKHGWPAASTGTASWLRCSKSWEMIVPIDNSVLSAHRFLLPFPLPFWMPSLQKHLLTERKSPGAWRHVFKFLFKSFLRSSLVASCLLQSVRFLLWPLLICLAFLPLSEHWKFTGY